MGNLTDLSAGFVVRVWREPVELDSNAVEWKGSIECVRCGERRYFNDIARMNDFMRRHLQIIGLDGLFLRHED